MASSTLVLHLLLHSYSQAAPALLPTRPLVPSGLSVALALICAFSGGGWTTETGGVVPWMSNLGGGGGEAAAFVNFPFNGVADSDMSSSKGFSVGFEMAMLIGIWGVAKAVLQRGLRTMSSNSIGLGPSADESALVPTDQAHAARAYSPSDQPHSAPAGGMAGQLPGIVDGKLMHSRTPFSFSVSYLNGYLNLKPKSCASGDHVCGVLRLNIRLACPWRLVSSINLDL
jgi:hypothetical protein